MVRRGTLLTRGSRLIATAACLASCGSQPLPATSRVAPSMELRETEPDAKWALVRAPEWSPYLHTTDTPEGPCGVSGDIRACGSPEDGLVLGPYISGLRFQRYVDGYYHFDDGEERFYSAYTFMGDLHPIHAAAAIVRPVEWSWDSRLSHIDDDGALLFARGGQLVRADLPGRTYDAYFYDEQVGIALVEPGVVFVTADGGTTLAPVAVHGPPPQTIAAVPANVIPPHRPSPHDDDTESGESAAFRERWQRWLVSIGQQRGITIPDLPPPMVAAVSHPGALFADFLYIPLADGWLVHGDGEKAQVVLRDSAVTRSLASPTPFVSRDGRVSLSGAGTHVLRASSNSELYEDAHADTSYPLPLPSGFTCAAVVALAPGALVLGGDNCPSQLCGDAPLVRVDFDELGVRDIVPYVIDGVPLRSSVHFGPCFKWGRDPTSPYLVDGTQIRAALPTDGGLALVTGPLEGPLHATPLPAPEGHIAFADANHGVFAGPSAVWLTSDAGVTWTSVPISSRTPLTTSELIAQAPECSRDACRIGSSYWASPAFRAAVALERTSDVSHGEYRSATHVTNLPWDPPPPTLPTLESCPARADSLALPFGGALFRVRRDRRHTPLSVSWWSHEGPGGQNVRVPRSARPGPDEHWSGLAATSDLILFRVQHRGGHMRLAAVTRRGRVRVSETAGVLGGWEPLASPVMPVAWLPRTPGGLAVLFAGRTRRFLLDVDRNGAIRAERDITGFPVVRNELLVEVAGEVGLAVQSRHRGTTFYSADGTDRTIPSLATPDGPCAAPGRDDVPPVRAASLWHTHRESPGWGCGTGLPETPPLPRLVISRHTADEACIEQVVVRMDGIVADSTMAGAVRGAEGFATACVNDGSRAAREPQPSP